MTARHRSSRPRAVHESASLPLWAALCFFASGAAGLLYEVVWSKQLAYLLGNSLQAVATVVAAFLCGLALGARLLGPALGKRGDGARIYARLEWGVALLGVVSLPLLRGLDPLVGILYRSLGGEGAAFALARVALLFVVLIPPAALMGATLPVLVGRFERDRVGPTMARLYALNTFGAVMGTVAGGFMLLPALGLAATTWIAAGLNAVAGLVAWKAPGRASEVSAAPSPPETPSPKSDRLAGNARLAFALLFLLSGFAALSYQIAWVRIFTLVFGSSVYSFSAVLGLYLLGIGIGSVSVAPFLRRGASLAGFGLLQLALAATAAIQLVAFSRLPEWMYALAERSGARWSVQFTGELALLAAFLLVPCALLGAVFPLATQLLQRRDSGHATGLAYAVNTVGTIAGSLTAGFVTIPMWGVQATHVFTLCLSGAIGLGAFTIAFVRRETAGRDWSIAAATLASVAILAIRAPQWDPALMSIGAYRPVQAHGLAKAAETAPGEGSIVRRVARAERVLYYGEGINGSVLVGAKADGSERWLRVGGKVDASTGKDMETQVLLGLIPAACADSGARTLVIGLGSGFTLSAALAAGAGPTEVVELEPRVVEASRFFHASSQQPLDDPRVHLVLGDARTHLAHGRGLYGLIVSEPSNPWIAGVNNLFTVDFYRRVQTRLEPHGVFCQWIQLYELEPRTLATMVASFLDVFPEGQAYRMCRGADLLLVAAPSRCRLALERLRSIESLRVLHRIGIQSPESLAGYYAGTLSSLRRIAAGAPLNRDDLPIVEYRAPRDLVNVGRSALLGKSLEPIAIPFAETPPGGPLFSAWSHEGWFESRARMFIDQGDLEHAEATARAAAGAGFAALARRLNDDVASIVRRGQAVNEAERARALLDGGHEQEGLAILRHAAQLDSTNGRIWLWIADRRRLAGDFAGAEANLARGRAHGDARVLAEASIISGMLEIDRSRPLVAATRFRQVQRWNPKRPEGYLYEACALAAGGDAVGAKQALRRGLRRLPGEADLSALLATME